MDLQVILKYLVVASAVGMAVAILLQAKSGGLGTVFGGSSGGEAYRSKRGMEAVLHNLTIFLALVFAVSSLLIAVTGV